MSNNVIWLRINSHRARDKARALVHTYPVVNWPSMIIYYVALEDSKSALADIKGVTVLKKQPTGTFTHCIGKRPLLPDMLAWYINGITK